MKECRECSDSLEISDFENQLICPICFDAEKIKNKNIDSKFAYPQIKKLGEAAFSCGGLTKREYFAAMAMQSICQDRTSVYSIKSIARGAVEYADALIAELNNLQK